MSFNMYFAFVERHLFALHVLFSCFIQPDRLFQRHPGEQSADNHDSLTTGTIRGQNLFPPQAKT